MTVSTTRAYRVAVAVTFGLIGFGVNFLDIEFMEGATFKISILAGLFFPLVIALAWGWRYGLLSALAGGCQTMWWLWSGDGWGVLYSVPVFTLWIVWHGWWAERRVEGHPWYASLFAVEVPFRIVIELGFLVVFRWLVSLNPPPWDSALSWDQVSSAWLQTVAIKHVVAAYILLTVAYVTLSLGVVRRFFGLPPRTAQRETTAIYAGAALFGVLLWTLDALVQYFAFPREGQTFWGIAVHEAGANDVFMRFFYIAVSMLAGIVLARLNRSRVELQELLYHRNRILAAIRNVNQLIVSEKNSLRLLDEACRLLVENQGYYNAWIVLMEDGRPVEPFFHAGFNGGFAPMAERLRAGKIPICAQAALSSDAVQVKDDPPAQCTDCPLSSSYAGHAGLILRIEHTGRVFGWMSLSCPGKFARSAEEHDLLTEVVGDIGFALHAIEARETLAQQEIRFQELADSLQQVVYEIDLDGRFTYVNTRASEMFGYTQQDFDAGLNVFQMFIPEDRDRVSLNIARLMAGEKLGGVDYTALKKDQSAFPVMIYSTRILRDGEAAGLRGLLVDVTDQKRAEETRRKLELQLLQAQKMESVGRLAGGVAHDFNNMLGVIMGNAELALNRSSPDDKLRANLKEILDAAQRSTDITRQLLAFGRRQTIDPKEIDLSETVESMLKMLRRLIGEDINLVWRPGPGRMPVLMDPSQLDQILANLCVNARDAIDSVGNLIIETSYVHFDEEYCADHAGCMPGEFIKLAVSDDGCGMDKKTLDNIFEPFFTTKGVGEGTGLGLSTVYGIVKQNDGFIDVHSEPEKGTTFRIYLPPCAGNDIGMKSQEMIEIPAGQGEIVLIVEDETAILKLAQKILENLGYTVLAASTSGKAKILAEEYADRIHLLITDVIMPEMNGRELAESLKANHPTIKVLFMSGYTTDVIAHQGVLEAGINFIQKPFTTRDLAEKVREALNRD
jgi:PAS domain S-box-containing protein